MCCEINKVYVCPEKHDVYVCFLHRTCQPRQRSVAKQYSAASMGPAARLAADTESIGEGVGAIELGGVEGAIVLVGVEGAIVLVGAEGAIVLGAEGAIVFVEGAIELVGVEGAAVGTAVVGTAVGARVGARVGVCAVGARVLHTEVFPRGILVAHG